MKKKFRYLIIIICVTLASVLLLLIGDSYFEKDYENPIRVAEAFAYSLMVKDAKHMKSWSCKEIHNKIDKLESSQFPDYLTSVAAGGHRSHFKLVCFRRLADTIVCTYALTDVGFLDFNPAPLFYTVVLEPLGPNSLWERVKEFVCFEVPFGDSIIGHPLTKQRWLAVDYYTEDDLDKIESQILIKFKTMGEILRKDMGEKPDMDKFFDQLKTEFLWRLASQNQWREHEKIEQNVQMRKLYKNYGGVDNKAKEN